MSHTTIGLPVDRIVNKYFTFQTYVLDFIRWEQTVPVIGNRLYVLSLLPIVEKSAYYYYILHCQVTHSFFFNKNV